MRPDGSLSPYEANISLFDAFKGTLDGVDSWQVQRFLVSQYVMASMAGVPAFYYNSFLATPNNLTGLEKTGRNRTINRRKWTLDEIDAHFEQPASGAGRVLNALNRMLQARSRCDAFHPEASQECLDIDTRVFALKRANEETNDTVVCLFNLTRETVSLDISMPRMHAVRTRIWSDGINELTDDYLRLGPYSSLWLSNVSAS